MKRFIKLSLQWRVTLLTALVLIACSVALTAFSMLNAQRNLIPLLEEAFSIIRLGDNSIAITKDDIFEDGLIEDDLSKDDVEAGDRFGKTTPQQAKQRFDVTSILFCLILTAVGTGVVHFVSGKALKPVRSLSKQVSKIDEHNLSQRLPEGISNDEVSSLTKSFNHAIDRLDEAFKRQKRFSASAAHELKTPLATMKAGIQVLSLDENTTLEEYRENAHMTETSVDRLTGVVNDLLLLASAVEDTDEIKEEVYLSVMFEAIFSELAPVYDNLGITYEIDCNNEKLHGNSALLYRAFYNLIENAYKYNHENGSIFISVCETKGNVKIDISDDGYGIPSEHLPLIFEAFYRVDASRSRKIAGSGLGLSIVKAIIERHGGTISVSSEEGTNFEVQLPQ
ncbi:sensor histidine kinase [Clostridium sp. UBA6640]|uniref:sensor histidine kinase n=1 Tax=Clostridium sp. UBA6640 TaxID=1946370 RepID=UPI0025BC834C|nr:ATP-binding protein [Clostridium sp. UBA6640]